MATRITDAIDFANFNEQGDTNGSGIDTSDTFNNWRRKTNGIINELTRMSTFAKANILMTVDGTEPKFSISGNSHNIDALTYIDQVSEATITVPSTTGVIRVTFTTPAPTSDYIVFAQLHKAGEDPISHAHGQDSLMPSVSTYNQTSSGLTIQTEKSLIQSDGDGEGAHGLKHSMFWSWPGRVATAHSSISLVVFT